MKLCPAAWVQKQRPGARTTMHGAFMEPSGRNRWQPVANGKPRKWLNQAKTVAVGCDGLPIGAHGKEGVDGSSPSEGFAKVAANRRLPFAIRTMNRMLGVHQTSTARRNDRSIAL